MATVWNEVRVSWDGEMRFSGTNLAGSRVSIGTSGGEGISPMAFLLIGLAGCTAVDIVSILKKKRQELINFEVDVRGARAGEHPKVYTDIEVIYRLWGETLDPKAVEQAIHLSEDKYCSASAMLGAVARIRSSYVINPSGDANTTPLID